jgi:hypothetical protein
MQFLVYRPLISLIEAIFANQNLQIAQFAAFNPENSSKLVLQQTKMIVQPRWSGWNPPKYRDKSHFGGKLEPEWHQNPYLNLSDYRAKNDREAKRRNKW